MIIAVDFDGTLMSDGAPNTQLISRLRSAQANGDCVILWTCREGKSLMEALMFLRQNGLVPNYVNDNAPQSIKALGRNSRKILADIYIDDKAVK